MGVVGEISDNILRTVQDTDILTVEG